MEIFTVKLNDYYKGLNDCATLTAYLPYNLKELDEEDYLRPAIVLCPGGGYGIVSEREGEPIALNLLSLKINVFILNYTVAKDGKHPDQLIEVAAAFDLIKKNAKKWHTDKDNIGIMGFSAGGHLAAHYSNRYGDDEVKAVIENPSRPDFSILCYPVITANPQFSHQRSFLNLTGADTVTEDIVNKFSCELMVSEDTPKAFIFTTASDNSVPAINSLLYAEALAKNNIPYTLHVYGTGNHGLSTFDETTLGKNWRLPNDDVKHTGTWLNELKHWIKYNVYSEDDENV